MNRGTKHTPETRAKMSAAHPKREVIGFNPKTGDVTFLKSTRAAKDKGWASSNIVACCKGRKHSCYGFLWRYLDAIEENDPVFGKVAEKVRVRNAQSH